MARNKGNFAFAANFEVKTAAPLDPRMVVDTKAELTNKATWPLDGDVAYVYDGLRVYCKEDKAIYVLTNKANYTNIASWKKVGDEKVSSDNVYIGSNTSSDLTTTLNSINNTINNLSTTQEAVTFTKVTKDDGVYLNVNLKDVAATHASVGNETNIGARVNISTGTAIGEHDNSNVVYIGNSMAIGQAVQFNENDVWIDLGVNIGTKVNIGANTNIGASTNIGEGTTIKFLDDASTLINTASLGANAAIGYAVSITEDTTNNVLKLKARNNDYLSIKTGGSIGSNFTVGNDAYLGTFTRLGGTDPKQGVIIGRDADLAALGANATVGIAQNVSIGIDTATAHNHSAVLIGSQVSIANNTTIGQGVNLEKDVAITKANSDKLAKTLCVLKKTDAEYNNLTTKDANTLYVVV